MAASSPLKKQQKSNHRSGSSREELPDDVVFMSILPRLSYKSLSKFKCVSKTWRKTISDDAKFAQRQSVSPSPISCCALLSQCYGNKFQFFNTFGCPIGFNPLHHRLFRNPDAYCRKIIASSCGLVCILFTDVSLWKITGYVHICNLATGEGEVISVNLRDHYDIGLADCNIGLAFDPSIEPDCFQLVHPRWHARYLDNCSEVCKVEYKFNVFSSKTGWWVRSKQTIIMEHLILKRASSSSFGKSITMKNVVYWDCREYIICFDPWKDVAGFIRLPKKKYKDLKFVQELGTYNGCITCTRMNGRSIQVQVLIDQRMNVWEMRHVVNLDRVVNSNPDLFMEFWLVIGKSSGGSFEDLFGIYEPFPYEGGNVLFFKACTQKAELVFSYDLEAKTVAKFCEFRVMNCRWDFDRANHRVFTYHNSMVKFPPLRQPPSSMAIY